MVCGLSQTTLFLMKGQGFRVRRVEVVEDKLD